MKQFNLTILQLVLPLASMSKAEYKQAYGIDLDDIEIEKVTLVQEEGSKNKYFVDEIKATEEGFDIYAGGKILSIGETISVTENAYSVENAKPLYFHPITIFETSKISLFMFIINNSEDPLDTAAKLVSYVKSNPGRFMLSGSIYEIAYYLSPSYIISDEDTVYVLGIDNVGNNHTTSVNQIDFSTLIASASIYDIVNKIN